MPSKVYVVEDDVLVRSLVARVLGRAGVAVTEFDSAEAFLAAPRDDAPGCLVLDLQLPGLGGLDLLDRLRREGRPLPAVVLSSTSDVDEAVRAMKAGAEDFIRKPFERDVLLESVRRALARAEQRAALRDRQLRLSPRERQVMDAVVEGLTNRQIADRLGISARTVEVHRAEVMAKMEAGSVPALVEMALELRRRD